MHAIMRADDLAYRKAFMPRTSNPQILSGDHGHQRVIGGEADADAAEVSRYVADICAELSKMTKSARLMMLSYLLAMARQEAERIARDRSPAK